MRTLLLALLLTACSAEPVETPPPEALPAQALDVSIPAEGLTLEGELLLPDRVAGEAVQGVVLVHGSGPNSRDGVVTGQLNMGFGFEIAVYRELAEGLQARGYAVLRYDKRTCFSQNGCTNSYPTPTNDDGMAEFMADADTALTFLAARPDIAGVSVVGHSQGGTFVPLLADQREDLASGVVLAGAYDGIDVLLRYQHDFSEELLLELGYEQSVIDAQLADLDAMATDVEALAAGTFVGTTISGIPASFWQEWLDLGEEAIAAAQSTNVPMSAVSGDYDWNVPPDQTEAWHALGLSGEVVGCVTHALNCVSQPDWQAIGAGDIGQHLDETLLDSVAAELP